MMGGELYHDCFIDVVCDTKYDNLKLITNSNYKYS